MSYGFTLAVDGSTYAGSAAVISDRTVIAARDLPAIDTPGRSGREEGFLPMVAACLDESGVSAGRLERVVCGAGPGSFTSLRIAASIAKGIAVGAGCPLFAVSSLMLIVADLPPGRYLATSTAMRGEVFASLLEVSVAGRVVELGAPTILAEQAAASEARGLGATLAGSAPHAQRIANLLPDVIAAGPRDIDSWEPVYGRLAEAQVRWEAAHGRPLTAAG